MRFGNLSLPSNPPLWPPFCSLEANYMGPEAGKVIAKALETNKTVQTIK